MKTRTNLAFILVLVLVWCNMNLTYPILLSDTDGMYSHRPMMSSLNSVQMEDSDYVWQEINGFCYWAAITMALRAVGVDVDLHEFFAVSGIGCSAAYVRYNDTWSFLAGSMYIQVGQLVPITGLYGVEQVVYLDETSYFGSLALEIWSQWNPHLIPLDGGTDAFQVMKDTIDDGLPVVLWVDPYYLPAVDYDLLRVAGAVQDETLPESGHAILVRSYNDTSSTVDIVDPGVGSFGDNFGYPADGRWAYSMNYSLLNKAWKPLSYGMTVIGPGNGTSSNFESELGEFLVDRLLGESESYIGPDSTPVFFLHFGERAFRGLSYDMTSDGILAYLERFDSKEEQETSLMILGYLIECSMTLQYLSYRTAIETLPTFLPHLNLDRFLISAKEALQHMEALSDNKTLTSIIYLDDHDSLLSNAFISMMMEYGSTNDLASVLANHATELDEIASHLMAIADAWKSAGQELKEALSGDTVPAAPIALLTITGLLALIIVVARRRSQ